MTISVLDSARAAARSIGAKNAARLLTDLVWNAGGRRAVLWGDPARGQFSVSSKIPEIPLPQFQFQKVIPQNKTKKEENKIREINVSRFRPAQPTTVVIIMVNYTA